MSTRNEARASRWLRASVAFVWFATGVLVLHPLYREIGETHLEPLGLGEWIMWATCAFEVLIAVRVAFGKASTWLVTAQIAMIAGFTVILATTQPMLLVHPMGVLTKNFCLVAVLGTSWLLEREGWTKRAVWLLRVGMAGIWITEGLFPKILFQQEMELAIARDSPLVPMDASTFLMLLGAAQLVSGVLALALWGRLLRALLWVQFSALVVLPFLVAWNDIEPWVHPFGPLTKTVPIAVGTLVLVRHLSRNSSERERDSHG